tara:strand:+ start:1784 stop:2233 length:450 start_codon:yes stop_codon:yes gene_type:complete
MKEVTVYEVVEKTIVVGDFREDYQYYRGGDTPSEFLHKTDEFVAYSYEEVTSKIDTWNRHGLPPLYVAYDDSFKDLVAKYQATNVDAVDAMREEIADYRNKWLRSSAEYDTLRKTSEDKEKVLNSLQGKVYVLEGSFWERFKFLFKGEL